jgi:phosphoenolpyruvate synthase/pyruvate phosphate dikinase
MKHTKIIQKQKNIFTSKSNVLKFLTTKIKNSKIENIYDFTLSEWKNNESRIIHDIIKQFSHSIVVRSSAIGEDSLESSEAGSYESILDVDSNSKNSIKNAVKKVIASYAQKHNLNPQNQILVQNQSKNISVSGVVFSRSTHNGSPYFIINYEEGGSTTGVTQGVINNIIKIYRNAKLLKIPKQWRKLINSIKEIELILDSTSLDIEFGITKSNQIKIYQVRPLISLNSMNLVSEKKIEHILKNTQIHYAKLLNSNKIPGKFTMYSDMADWNPAEIIGNNPNPLDYSLYNYLIMNKAWYEGRTSIGYQDLAYGSLLTKFGNKPYVDVRKSFNSLIPKNINKKLTTKLVNYYIKKLHKNPNWHDKVEFEIIFTCYDLLTKKKLKELKNHGFLDKEIITIKNCLIEFTNNIFQNFENTAEFCNKSIDQMIINRKIILSKLNSSQKTYSTLISTAEQLLFDCKKFGTTPFSTMARLAFIASVIFKSLVKRKYFSQNFADIFMNSLNTPLSNFREDVINLSIKKISKSKILKKYGHLRPGTYDITASRYDEQNNFFKDIKFNNLQKNVFSETTLDISKILKKNQLNLGNLDFFTFVRESLQSREILKFEFTHNLSDALKLILQAGNMLGFTREEISFLDINYILSTYKKYNKKELQKKWSKKIQQQQNKFSLQNFLMLPPIIQSNLDFEIISYYQAKPNFITSKQITSNTINLKNSNNVMLENKLILLENADPGYDWIFTKNPAGLITKYGGVASHMAIRCAEIALPAAIGCGELLFEQLQKSNKVLLDCNNEKIIILENSKIDNYIEEKKILKSLGYIK